MIVSMLKSLWGWVRGVPPRSPHWPAVERQHKLIEPACQWCGRLIHNDVHHIFPFEHYPERELDPANLITLCRPPGSVKHSCHYMQGHRGVSWKVFDPDIRAKCKARAHEK